MEGKPKVYITPNTTVEHLLQMGNYIQCIDPLNPEQGGYYYLPFWFEEVEYKGQSCFQAHQLGALPEKLVAKLNEERNTTAAPVAPIPATNLSPIRISPTIHPENTTQKEPFVIKHEYHAIIDLILACALFIGSIVNIWIKVPYSVIGSLIFLWSLSKYLIIYTNTAQSFFSKFKKWRKSR